MNVPLETATRDALERILGHQFANPLLLCQAVTHRSVATGRGEHGYERLEFLGDRVLGMAVAAAVFHHFGDEAEGKLSMRHVELVRKETLAAVAIELGIDALIVMSPGEEHGGTRGSASVLADIIEALLAALYLDGGEAAAFGFVERNWKARMLAHAKPPRDAKTTLQEWALARGLPLPSYEMREQTGPAHAPTITICVVVEGLGRIETQGRSRRVAEQEAARLLLEATVTHEMKT